MTAQELAVSNKEMEGLADAFRARGFTYRSYSTEAAKPTREDSQCGDPLDFSSIQWMSLTGLAPFIALLNGVLDDVNGGLVTWSRFPIKKIVSRQWCTHGFPTPAGYLTTVLDVAGTAVTIINLHMMPHFDILQGIDYDIRTHQFGELSRFADIVSKATASVNAPAAVVLAGDFNEDAYNLKLHTVDRQGWAAPCSIASMIGRDGRLATMFKQVGLDLHSACDAGKIGTPTWDTTKNDLADLFSDGGKLEILDYIVRHSYNGGTGGAVEDVGEASALTLAAATPWTGTFCESSEFGTSMGMGTYSKKVTALTDHQAVLTRIPIPVSNAASYSGYSGSGFGREPLAEVLSKLDDALARFDKGGAQEAACGQKDTRCLLDEHCCVGQNVWGQNVPDLECSYGKCDACSEMGGRCGAGEGSDCCDGLHCELLSIDFDAGLEQGTCISVYGHGEDCLFDAECDSQDCCAPTSAVIGLVGVAAGYFFGNGCDHDCEMAPCCN